MAGPGARDRLTDATPYCYAFTVRLQDTDAAGVLFFANLFRHAHDAYEAFMEDLGFPLDAAIRDRRWRLPIVHSEADYRAPIGHGERITVALEVAEVGHSAFTLDYAFHDAAGRVAARARTVHVAIDTDSATSKALPEALRGRLSGHLAPRRGGAA